MTILNRSLFIVFFALINGSLISQDLFDVIQDNSDRNGIVLNDQISKRETSKYNKKISRIDFNESVITDSKLGRFKFMIPDDTKRYTAQSSYVDFSDLNNYQFNAELFDERNTPVGFMLLSKVEGAIFGDMFVNGRSFVIEDFGINRVKGLSNRVSYLIEKDLTHKIECGTKENKELNLQIDSDNDIVNKSLMSCTKNVRVLVLFTASANNARNGHQAAVTYINQINQALRNSGVGSEQLTFQLADSRLFNGINDQLDFGDDTGVEFLTRLMSNNQVNQIRNAEAADIVTLLTDSPAMEDISLGGIAVTHNENDPTIAHNIVQIDIPTDTYTFSHEVGHTMGCKHDWNRSTNNGLKTYARGHLFSIIGVDELFGTLMSRYWRTSNRVLNYSNPSIFIPGKGYTGNSDVNNARQLKEAALRVSNYRTGQDPNVTNITGPTTIYNTSSHAMWCATGTSCSLNILRYRWSYSTNGFNYYNFGSNSSCAGRAQNSFGNGSTIYIRLKVTYQDGTRSTRTLAVRNLGNIYQKKSKSNNDTVKSTIDISPSKLVAHVYPNPVNNGTVSLDILIGKDDVITKQLYDSSGTFVKEISSNSNYYSGKNTELIDLSDLNKGLYYIRISSRTSEQVLPLVVQ